jgi:divalent metal cation (Fe/Co/Zn/Cd) transporter
MFTRWNPWAFFDESLYTWGLDRVESLILFVALLVIFAVSVVRYKTGDDIGKALLKQNLWFRWVVLIFFMVAIVVYGE